MKRRLVVLVITSGLLLSAAALGESSSVLSSARELAKQGLQAYDAGRYEEAAEKLAKAYQVVHVPTLATNQARALVKLGKLVAASELYLEATRIPKDQTWQSVQMEAQKDAEREREALLPLIPRLTVLLTGAAPNDVTVSIDGAVIPGALIGTEQLQDPGVHTVLGKRGAETVNERIVAKEGDHVSVTLQFKSSVESAAQSAVGAPNQRHVVSLATPSQVPQPTTAAVASDPAPSAPSREAHANNQQKLLGWIGLGAGGAGVLAGSVAGLFAISKHSSLDDSSDCSSALQKCTLAKKGDVDSYNKMLTVSTVGFVAGGVLAAAGVTLLLTAPKQENRPRLGLWLSPNSANLMGRF